MALPRRSLPGLDRPTTTLGLGTVTFERANRDAAFEVLDAWLAVGGTLIDTAAVYRLGESEAVIGAWLRASGARDEVILMTKGVHPDQTDWLSRMTPAEIDADLSASLARLGVSSVDLYLVHRDDPSVPVGVILEALASHVAAGRVGAFGVSNWSLERLDTALDYVVAHDLPPLACSSSYLGLASPVGTSWPGVVDASDEASRRWYTSHPLPLVAWSSIGNGFFRADADLGAEHLRAYRGPLNLARRTRVAELAAQRGLTPNQVALAWVLCQPCSPIALVGTTSVGHLREATEATGVSLTEAELRWLETGAPGEGD